MERIAKLEAFLKEQPNDCFLLHALALEYVKVNNDLAAEKLFLQIFTIDENYVGSYYHLAKLYERIGNEQNAIATYEKGMQIAQQLKEQHAYGELRSAYEEYTF